MKISEFDFELPADLIAQEPLEERSSSRMLVVDCSRDAFSDYHFSDLPELLREDDLLVVNNTRVFPARLFGQTSTGANVEVFLVEEFEKDTWTVLAKPGKRLKPGKSVTFSEDLKCDVVERGADGRVIIKFEYDGDFEEIVDRIGSTPLPPYIKREKEEGRRDLPRYQTVYASERGAIAAPTAGLHFNEPLFEKIKDKGIEKVEITLHVGYGTFEPVRVESLHEHRVSSEKFSISDESADRINQAKRDDRRVIAVGTTSTRALESATSEGVVEAGKRSTTLTITPGYEFRCVDGLITNFHLPKSSLLVLVSTFGGHQLVMDAYRHAVSGRYRFYSYGDCMLLI